MHRPEIELCWSSFLGHRDRLFDCRLLLEGIGWQVAQFGVQSHAVDGTAIDESRRPYAGRAPLSITRPCPHPRWVKF